MIDRDLCGVPVHSILAKFDAGLDTAAIFQWIARAEMRSDNHRLRPPRRGLPYPTEAAIANALATGLAERRALRGMRDGGLTCQQIGERLGVSKVAISKRLGRQGRPRWGIYPWTRAEETKLRALWGSCLSAREIASKVGRTRLAIIGKAERLNLPSMLPRKRARAA